jgi:acyl carrier protein
MTSRSAPAIDDALGFVRETLEMLDPDARIERLTLDVDLRTLELESITLLSLMASLEERYGARLSNDALTRIRTLRDLLTFVLRDSCQGTPRSEA